MKAKNKYQKIFILIKDFLKPSDIGAFFDGNKIIYDEKSRLLTEKAGRLYLSVSHSCLYFQTIKFPFDIPQYQLESSISFEIMRSLDLDDSKNLSFVILSNRNNQILLSFQKRDFFENIISKINYPWILSGIFPSFLSILSWFYHKNKQIIDGLYYILIGDIVEGFIWDKGIYQILPSNIHLSAKIIDDYSGPKFEIKTKNPSLFLANASRLVCRLPSSLIKSFNHYHLRKRPNISPRLFFLWSLPICLLGVNFYLNHLSNDYHKYETLLRGKLKKIKSDYKTLMSQKEKLQSFSLLRKEIDNFKKQPDILDSLYTITNLLSSDVWIRKFEFRYPNEIRIWGEGKNALALLKRLQLSESFYDVRFLSTVSKNPRTQKEYFAISLKIK